MGTVSQAQRRVEVATLDEIRRHLQEPRPEPEQAADEPTPGWHHEPVPKAEHPERTPPKAKRLDPSEVVVGAVVKYYEGRRGLPPLERTGRVTVINGKAVTLDGVRRRVITNLYEAN